MLFKDIPGQTEIKERLIRSVLQNRVSHAQLFTGSEGVMKLPMAVAYARFLCCTRRVVPEENILLADACGTCPSCLKFNNLAHPDLHFIFPVITPGTGVKPTSDLYLPLWREMWKKKQGMFSLTDWHLALEAENKQPIIYTEDCNQIIKKLSYKSYESEYKVMIIWMVEKMNQSAAPRILKILEEPPDKTLFILVARDLSTMLTTILSRTQVIRFPRITGEEIAGWLEGKGFGKETVGRAAYLSEGNVLKALELTQDDDQVHFERFRTWLRYCFKPQASMNELVALSEELATLGREAQKRFLLYGLSIIRQCFIMGQTGRNPRYESEEALFIRNLAPFVHAGNIAGYDALFNEAIYHIEGNAYQKVLFLDVSLKLVKLIKQTA